jgi:hypothetical protein
LPEHLFNCTANFCRKVDIQQFGHLPEEFFRIAAPFFDRTKEQSADWIQKMGLPGTAVEDKAVFIPDFPTQTYAGNDRPMARDAGLSGDGTHRKLLFETVRITSRQNIKDVVRVRRRH